MQTAPRVLVCTAALAVLASVAAPAGAQQKMRPGLWEHSVQMKTQSGQMEAAMAQAQKSMDSLPPAQRKQMQDMLAAQGIGLGPRGQSIKVCITPEQAAIDQMPQQDGCTQKVQRVNASTLKMAFQCQGDQDTPPTSGEGTVNFQGPTAYTGQFKIKTAIEGKPEQIDMAQSGKWLSDQCGAILPVPAGR